MPYVVQAFTSFKLGLREKVCFVVLVYLDVFLTLYALQSGFSELNPFALRIFSDPQKLFLVKGLSPALIAFFVPGKFLLPAILAMSFVTLWNFKELLLALG